MDGNKTRLYPKAMTNMNLKLEGTQRDGWQNLLATIVGNNNKQYLSTPSWFTCTVSHDQLHCIFCVPTAAIMDAPALPSFSRMCARTQDVFKKRPCLFQLQLCPHR
jgi:hypothetical protein